ncbi:hypothetical protein LCGC14_0821390 [marine sediment metagenome]|uniref:Uncharacterized protein n=1 Tax=marine sediment metagenome TaxID=412755 RepID=A0A0F9S3P2_9ZZZZ
MSRQLIIQKFCLDYDVKENSDALNNLTVFADEIRSTEILAKVLDSSNHPTSEGGRKIRPNIATLRSLLGQFANERAQEKRQEAMSNVSPGSDCFYCTAGYILGIQERNGLWSTYTAGRCDCNQGDDIGHMSKWRPARPTQEIQDYARDSGLNCPLAADKMVYTRNQGYRDQDKTEEQIPF